MLHMSLSNNGRSALIATLVDTSMEAIQEWRDREESEEESEDEDEAGNGGSSQMLLVPKTFEDSGTVVTNTMVRTGRGTM